MWRTSLKRALSSRVHATEIEKAAEDDIKDEKTEEQYSEKEHKGERHAEILLGFQSCRFVC